jgi:hypothetical protein
MKHHFSATIFRPQIQSTWHVRLTCQELPELRLACTIHDGIRVDAKDLQFVPIATLKSLCGSGMAMARRKLSLFAGLAIQVSEIAGQWDLENQVGLCYATFLAISLGLGRDTPETRQLIEDWQIVELRELE